MLKRFCRLVFVASVLWMAPGCDDDDGDAPAAAQDGGGGEQQAPANAGGDATSPISLGAVTWLHANVSNWAQTANLASVRINGGNITLNYDKAGSWPGANTAGANVNANPWIFVNRGGQWYAATWEWLRVGQTTKSTGSVHGSHIGVAPLNGFSPVSGETYGFMVSGLARDNTRNVQERSNIVMVTWP
jgi:hypothetical protein